MTEGLNPAAVAQRFLELVEQRELAAAETLLASDFEMVFPGSGRLHSLQQLVEWAHTRYRFVRKTFDHIDTVVQGEARAVVYCCGTLSGEWTDGRPFEGVRFIDRFELQDLRIRRQAVWNDMALHFKAHP
jgi:hypothetical protein